MITPSTPTSTVDDIVGRPSAVVARPNAPFLLVHNTGRLGSWEVREEGLDRPTWVPSCDNYPLVPGAAYVRQRSDRMSDPEREEIEPVAEIARRDGRKILPKALGYCKAIDCIAPGSTQRGTMHVRAWSDVLPPLEEGKLAIERVDFARQNREFLAYYASGHIPAPDPRLLERQHRSNVGAVLAIKADKNLPSDLKLDQTRDAVALARRELFAARPWDPDYTPPVAAVAEVNRLDPDYTPPAAEPEPKGRGRKAGPAGGE